MQYLIYQLLTFKVTYRVIKCVDYFLIFIHVHYSSCNAMQCKNICSAEWFLERVVATPIAEVSYLLVKLALEVDMVEIAQ